MTYPALMKIRSDNIPWLDQYDLIVKLRLGIKYNDINIINLIRQEIVTRMINDVWERVN